VDLSLGVIGRMTVSTREKVIPELENLPDPRDKREELVNF
jgi:hypothetical protein